MCELFGLCHVGYIQHLKWLRRGSFLLFLVTQKYLQLRYVCIQCKHNFKARVLIDFAGAVSGVDDERLATVIGVILIVIT